MSMDTFTAIVERDATALRGYCAHLLTIPDDAEDVSQETFCAAWRHRAEMPADMAGQRRWLHRIARNRCFDRNRRERVLRRVFPLDLRLSSPDPAAEALTHIDVQETTVAMGRLTSGERDALMWNVDMSGKEMGALMGVTAAGAKSRVNRARVRLRAAMAG